MQICTIGDLLLDVVVRLDEPIAEDADAYGRTHVGVGGQAANVAAWVAELGASARFVGKRADDLAGRLLLAELRRRGVDVRGPETGAATGAVVSIAEPDGRRTMLSDRGVSPDLFPEDIDASWLAGCDWLHVSGYALLESPLREAALRAAGIARSAGARISLDFPSDAAVRRMGVAEYREACLRLDPITALATEREQDLVGRLPVVTWVLKRGERGCRIESPDGVVELPAVAAEVVDATGAGDAFAAGFLVDGPELAVAAAARCVATLGAVP